jgi:phosphohistidine swiveling domain-containing protein
MSCPLILPLEACRDRTLAGGKAVGLGTLIGAGFRVPPGICLTTVAYHTSLRQRGFDPVARWQDVLRAHPPLRGETLSRCRAQIITLGLTRDLGGLIYEELARLGHSVFDLWAVRSSGTEEDEHASSFAGVYTTTLGAAQADLPKAIVECWASLWTDRALEYLGRAGQSSSVPAMGVILQHMINPRASGVGFSRHPVTGRTDEVVINALLGIAEPLVSGRTNPDQHVVRRGGHSQDTVIVERQIAPKRSASQLSAVGLTDIPVAQERQTKPALTDKEILALTSLIHRVEQTLKQSVDVEWALDEDFWLLQARPISSRSEPQPSGPSHTPAATDLLDAAWADRCTWSRANFKETLPEVPSPIALSFVREFMEVNIVRHYRELGCRIPAGLSAVRIVQGRPYINMTLLQSVIAQLGGDPSRAIEQMGGEPDGRSLTLSPRLPWPRLLRALLLLEWRIWHAGIVASRRFMELKRLAGDQRASHLEQSTEAELLDRMDKAYDRLEQLDLTFAIVSGVSQALYALGTALQGRLKDDWRPLLNAATQGLGTIISARQIIWLKELAETARRESTVREFLEITTGPPEGFRELLAGTRFLQEFDAFQTEYGHRAIGESDVMSPRFAETPGYLLGVIRRLMTQTSVPDRDPRGTRALQPQVRDAALARIRVVFGLHKLEWFWFHSWYKVLCHYLSLREANRHALMHYVGAARDILRMIGKKLTARDLLASQDDLFFLTPEEIHEVVDGLRHEPRSDRWKTTVAARRAERERQAAQPVPHTIWATNAHPTTEPRGSVHGHGTQSDASVLYGLPISSGVVQGPVRIVLSPADLTQIRAGDILVAPVIDPGMAPLFGLAAGLIVELGGLLSHGAIIAREYGLPAIANVEGATRILQNGEQITLSADSGEVRRIDQSK